MFSSFKVRLMDERERKNAKMAPFNSNDGEPGGTRLLLKQKSSVPPRSINREQALDLCSLRRSVEPNMVSRHITTHQIKTSPFGTSFHLVSRVGLEPTTPSLRGSCSNQLSYRPKNGLPYYTTYFIFLLDNVIVQHLCNRYLHKNKVVLKLVPRN